MVQGCHLRFVQSFNDRDDRGIYEADVGICVAVAKLSHAPIVLLDEVLNSVRPGLNIGEAMPPAHQGEVVRESSSPLP